MKKAEEILTDGEINQAWQNADFGDTPKRDVILDTLKKIAQCQHSGHTAVSIVSELGLIWNLSGWDALSDKGLEYLLAASQPRLATTVNELEEMARQEFKNVGDDGLFPNHSDQDIWINGFITGYTKRNH